MVILGSFIAFLLRNFMNCESSYVTLATWLCGSLFILFVSYRKHSIKLNKKIKAGYVADYW